MIDSPGVKTVVERYLDNEPARQSLYSKMVAINGAPNIVNSAGEHAPIKYIYIRPQQKFNITGREISYDDYLSTFFTLHSSEGMAATCDTTKPKELQNWPTGYEGFKNNYLIKVSKKNLEKFELVNQLSKAIIGEGSTGAKKQSDGGYIVTGHSSQEISQYFKIGMEHITQISAAELEPMSGSANALSIFHIERIFDAETCPNIFHFAKHFEAEILTLPILEQKLKNRVDYKTALSITYAKLTDILSHNEGISSILSPTCKMMIDRLPSKSICDLTPGAIQVCIFSYDYSMHITKAQYSHGVATGTVIVSNKNGDNAGARFWSSLEDYLYNEYLLHKEKIVTPKKTFRAEEDPAALMKEKNHELFQSKLMELQDQLIEHFTEHSDIVLGGNVASEV